MFYQCLKKKRYKWEVDLLKNLVNIIIEEIMCYLIILNDFRVKINLTHSVISVVLIFEKNLLAILFVFQTEINILFGRIVMIESDLEKVFIVSWILGFAL